MKLIQDQTEPTCSYRAYQHAVVYWTPGKTLTRFIREKGPRGTISPKLLPASFLRRQPMSRRESVLARSETKAMSSQNERHSLYRRVFREPSHGNRRTNSCSQLAMTTLSGSRRHPDRNSLPNSSPYYRFWEALSGICSRTIQHPESQVNRLCITPDKKYLAAAGRHMVRLYDIKSSNPNPIMQFEGHTNNITGVAFHCEGKWMVTSSEDMTVRVWDTRSGQVQRNYQHTHPVNDVVIHPNQGELVSCDRGGNIRIWDLGESRCTHQLIPAEDVSMASVSVASDGSLLAAGNNVVRVIIFFLLVVPRIGH